MTKVREFCAPRCTTPSVTTAPTPVTTNPPCCFIQTSQVRDPRRFTVCGCQRTRQLRPIRTVPGGVFNFMLHPAFWFGMAMCDDQSAPNPGGSLVGPNIPCTPASDRNIFDSADPANSHYIGKHPGTGFMEMQFYPPGWFDSCDTTRWCAALNIDSLSENMNSGAVNNACGGGSST